METLRNPMDVHIIQDKLCELRGDSVWVQAVREGAVKNISSTIRMIKSQAKDNRSLVANMIGEELLTKIENF